MSEMKVQFGEVHSKTSELRSRIEERIYAMESAYATIQSSLEGLDSASNATYIQTMERNKYKAYVMAETLNKLLAFLENSAIHVEQEDKNLGGVFNTTPPSTGGSN